MIRKTYLYVMFLTAILFMAGCAVHQWPEPRLVPPDPEPDSVRQVTIRLHYESDLWLWEHLYDPKLEKPEELYPDSGVDSEHPGTSAVYSNEISSGVMSIRLRVYNVGNTDDIIQEHIIDHELSAGYDCEVALELTSGNYEVAVWSHLLESSDVAPFYEPANFSTIYILDDNYCGNTDYRDGYCGRSSFAITKEESIGTYNCDVVMRRPMGKFEFVTTDLSEFLDRETERRSLSVPAGIDDYRVIISYPYYYPNAYNMIADDIASGSGYSFETKMTVTGTSEASLGFDYVFIKNIRDGAVQAQVSVYDIDGTCVAASRVIMVPIRRDHHTVLRGTFLSMDSEGGVGVNPDYDGDHNVTIP